jgi:spore germination protein GerM
LGSGAEIRDLYCVDAGLAVVDLNGAFADSHRSGVLVELLTMTSLVETLAANVTGISQVKFLVEGEERETLAGHADLSNPYGVASTAQLVTLLEPHP